MYSEHTFNEKDFVLKHNDAEIAMDSNFAAQSFWKDVRVRFFRKKSAVLGLILVVFIVLLAAFGPGMNEYTYSGQELSQKNFAPRVQMLENFGIFNGDEKMSTTTGSKTVNAYVEKGKEDVYYWFGSDTYGRDIWTRTWEVPACPDHRGCRRHHRYGHRHELWPDLRLLWRQGGYGDAALP